MPIGYPFDGQHDGIRNRLGMGQGSIAGLLASQYDGTNDYQLRGADLTGNADGKKYLASFFLFLDGSESNAQQTIFASGPVSDSFTIIRNTNRSIIFVARNSASDFIFIASSLPSSLQADGSWHHIISSVDLATPASEKVYVDGVDSTSSITFSDDTIDYTRTEHTIGAAASTTFKLRGRLSELYINFAENLDLSVSSNRDLFRTASNKPVFLGANGELPTGTPPIIYAPDGDATNNLGTGGNFTTTGALVSVPGPGV